MCRVQREKTWHSGRRGCILWPCQGQNGNPGHNVIAIPVEVIHSFGHVPNCPINQFKSEACHPGIQWSVGSLQPFDGLTELVDGKSGTLPVKEGFQVVQNVLRMLCTIESAVSQAPSDHVGYANITEVQTVILSPYRVCNSPFEGIDILIFRHLFSPCCHVVQKGAQRINVALNTDTSIWGSAETICDSDTRRSMVFPSPHSLFSASMVLGW